MPIKRLEDIEREKHLEKRDKVVDDINYVVDSVFKKPKREEGIIWTVLKFLLWLVLLVTVVNFILGNIWLVKFFVRELFLG